MLVDITKQRHKVDAEDITELEEEYKKNLFSQRNYDGCGHTYRKHEITFFTGILHI